MNNVSGISLDDYVYAMNNGLTAELEVFGVLRGGWYFNQSFYYCGKTYMKVSSASSLNLAVKIL